MAEYLLSKIRKVIKNATVKWRHDDSGKPNVLVEQEFDIESPIPDIELKGRVKREITVKDDT